MFCRASNRTLTCLRCQNRLAGPVRIRSLDRIFPSPSFGRRPQSTVAIEVPEDEHVTQSENYESQEHHGQEATPEPPVSVSRSPSETHRLQRRTDFRRWRPHNAEELGVNVLGKPAEVLILPTRKRKIAEAKSEENQAGKKIGLQKTLDSELKPISMAEALDNIDSMKEEMHQDTNVFSETEWKDLQRRLGSGFTRSQLHEYLQRATEHLEPAKRNTDLPADPSKRGLAAEIMLQVWGWKCQEQEDHVSQPDPPASSKSMRMNSMKLNYVMLHRKQQLGQISETTGVQIDVFKKKSKVKLSGTAAAVKEASAQLTQMLLSVQETVMELPKNLAKHFSRRPKHDPWLTTLMQKYGLLIQKDQDALRVVGPSGADVSVVLRDLLLFSGILRKHTASSICWDQGEQEPKRTTKALFYTGALPFWLQENRQWYRHIATHSRVDTDDLSTKHGGRALRKTVEGLLKAANSDQQKLRQYSVAPSSLTQEFTIEVGQAIFSSSVGSLDVQLAGETNIQDRQSPECTFVMQQGLLHQVLAKENLVPSTFPKISAKSAELKSNGRFLLRLQLYPVAESNGSPRFELFLSGLDARLGLKQQLEIKQVNAIVDEWQHAVLLPNQPADVLVTRQTKINLLTKDKVKPLKGHLNILRQLGSYLERAKSSPQPELPPIWRLDLSPLHNKDLDSTTKDDKASGVNSDQSNATAPDKPANPMYILAPPETLDIATYTSDAVNDRFIDHVFCDTNPIDKPRQRQVLRISTDSLSHLLQHKSETSKPSKSLKTAEKQRWIKDAVTAAYDIAIKLAAAEKAVGQEVDSSDDSVA